MVSMVPMVFVVTKRLILKFPTSNFDLFFTSAMIPSLTLNFMIMLGIVT